MTILINANIFPMTKMYNAKNPMLENGYVFIEGTAIKDIGYMKDFIAPNDECSKIIDLNGALITPGFVDAHSHIGIWEDGLNFEGADGNEETDPCTPHLKALDAINPLDPTFKEALLAGITSVVVGPGSANPIGGQILAMKTAGTRIDNMLIKEPLAIKMAFGENPKTVYNDKNQSPSTRMATAAIIREALEKAKEHLEQINSYLENTDENIRPDLDVKSEALIPLL
ncbi:MAG: amidohydrolase, partial [Oscillospiraceae bacterium]